MSRHGLYNLITTPTHFKQNLLDASLIDLYMTTDPELYSQHGTCPTVVSDHYIIFGARKKFKIKHDKTKIWARKYKSLDEFKLKVDLCNTDWSSVMDNNDPSTAWDNLVSIFSGVVDKHCPFKFMSFDDNLPVWATRELLSEIKLRNSLTKKADRTKNEYDIYMAERKRNYITGFKRNLQKTYFTRSIEEHKQDPKKLWKILRLLVGSGKSKTKIMSLNGRTGNEDMSNELNRFFSEIGPNLASQIPDSLLNQNYEFDNSRPTFKFIPVTLDEIIKLLMKIPNSKSTGLDGVPIRFLKLVPDIICPMLQHIINLSFFRMIVPQQWKSACITPLYKEGSRDDPGNYRPIAILPSCSKIL